MTRLFHILFGLSLILMAPVQFGVGGPVVGYLRVTCSGGSESTDTILSVPFQKAPPVQGTVTSVETIAGGVILHLAVNPGELGDFSRSPHLLSIENEAMAGRFFPVTGHSGAAITISTEPEPAGSVAAGDAIKLVSVWTLDTLFPPAAQSTIHVSLGVLPSYRQTEVLLFDTTNGGIELGPDRVFFLTPDGWRQVGEDYPSAGDTIIEPCSAFIVRHPAGAADTEFMTCAVVETGNVIAPLKSRSNGPQDNTVALMRPIATVLSELDLERVFEISSSARTADRRDELFVFGAASGKVNRLPEARYFRTAAGWVEDTGDTSFPIADRAVLPAGSALVIRKAAGNGQGGTQLWVNLARY